MPASMRDKVTIAISEWVESVNHTSSNAVERVENDIIVVGLSAIGHYIADKLPPLSEYTAAMTSLHTLYDEYCIRVNAIEAQAFENELGNVVDKCMINDRRIVGCKRFGRKTTFDHVALLKNAILERDTDDFVYDAVELVLEIGHALVDITTDEDKNSDEGDDSDEIDSDDSENSNESESGISSADNYEDDEDEDEEEDEDDEDDGDDPPEVPRKRELESDDDAEALRRKRQR